ncbi:MAG: chemotaxis protein CheW [Pseudomonadota bacterium]
MTDHRTHKKADDALELVAFCLSAQEFCVNITSVREIRGWTQETRLPLAPDYVRGVINLRGTVVPIIDLSARLGLPPVEPTARHVIIIFQIRQQVVGYVVDAVSDILTAAANDIQPTPDVGSQIAKDFVQGVVTVEERTMNLIGLEKILPGDNSARAAS